MLDEAREAPAAVARLLAADRDGYASLGAELRAAPPQSLLTIARGSSDHAAHYMAYLIMARLGRLVTSLPMSLITLYQSRLQCDGLVSFAFSQSGQSHDLVVPTRFFRDGGARTVAVVNDMASPLADAAQWTFDLHAGVETSVAATKSYIAQLVAGARVLAAGKSNPCFQPVSRNWREARRNKLVIVTPDQLHLLCGTLGGDDGQCSRDVLARKRLPCFVVDVHVDCSLLHDEFDHNSVVPPTHHSSVLRRVVAMSVAISESKQIENRRNYHSERFHLFLLMHIMALPIEHPPTQRVLLERRIGRSFLPRSARIASD